MPIFKYVDTIATSGVVTNIMQGSKFEFLPRNSVIRIYAVQDITAALGNVDLDFTLGNVVVGDGLAPNRVALGEGPDRNRDLLATGVGAGGDRIQIRAQETDAGTGMPIRVLVEINEL